MGSLDPGIAMAFLVRDQVDFSVFLDEVKFINMVIEGEGEEVLFHVYDNQEEFQNAHDFRLS
jgi:hypothetical protein